MNSFAPTDLSQDRKKNEKKLYLYFLSNRFQIATKNKTLRAT